MPLLQAVDTTRQVVVDVDGVATLAVEHDAAWEPVYEDRLVFNADGSPAMYEPRDPKTGARIIQRSTCKPLRDGTGAVLVDENGEPIPDLRTGQPFPAVQQTERVPVMVPGIVTRKELRDVPGRRIHVGWNAETVKGLLDDLGVDWGIIVRGEDGLLQIRESRMTAVLWQYTRMVADRVGDLERRLAALEA